MMRLASNSERNGKISALLTDVAEAMSRLVSEHIALARAELGQELSGLSTWLVQAVVSFAVLLLGYAFCCTALAAYLASRGMSIALALLLVAAANAVIGALGAYRAVRRISSQRLLQKTRDELDRSAALLPAGVAGKARVADDKRL